MLNFDRLTDEISTVAASALDEIVAALRGETLAGFALCSDAGAMGVSPAFNTSTNLGRNVRADPQDAAYHRWNPAEWDFESRGIEHFEKLNQRIRFSVAAVPAKEFGEFRAQLFDACVAALQRVRQLPRFADTLRGAAIVFSATGFEDPPSEKAWNAALNTPEDAQEFCRWLDSINPTG